MENTGTSSFGSRQGFDLRDGSRIVSLHDLFSKVQQMDEYTFHLYVNPESNVFADWIGLSLAKPGLARLLRQNGDKASFEILLQTYLSEDNYSPKVQTTTNQAQQSQPISNQINRNQTQPEQQFQPQNPSVQYNPQSQTIQTNQQTQSQQMPTQNQSNPQNNFQQGNAPYMNQQPQTQNNQFASGFASAQQQNNFSNPSNNNFSNEMNNIGYNNNNAMNNNNFNNSNNYNNNAFANNSNNGNYNNNNNNNNNAVNNNNNNNFNSSNNNYIPNNTSNNNTNSNNFSDIRNNPSYEPPANLAAAPVQKDVVETLIEESKKVSVSTQDVNDRRIEVPQPEKIVVQAANASNSSTANNINASSTVTASTVHPSTPTHTVAHAPVSQILSETEAKNYAEIMKKCQLELSKVIKGQEDVIEKVFLTLICDSHALLEGVPGLAKSFLVEALTKVISGTSFKRIQFMPDILPADVIGSQIYNPQKNEFVTMKGPIFANFVLADEINRAPPKTHAALMEAMQEKKINIEKDEYILDKPFLCLATQNPLENKGTYALPEAVLDRFMFKIILNYPKREDEKLIIVQNATTNSEITHQVQPVLTKEMLLEMQKAVKKVYLSARIKDYILDLVEATRGQNKDIIGLKFIEYGAGPRASIYLGIAARAQAMIHGRNYVLPEDLKEVAPYILRHRVCLNFKAKAHKISSDKIVEEILTKVNGL